MRTIKTKLFIAALILLSSLNSFSTSEPKVIGFFPSWKPFALNSIQWNKVTDIVYAFVLPNGDGSIKFDHYGTTETTFKNGLNNANNKAKSEGVKIHISFGGWSATHLGNTTINPDPIGVMAADPVARKKFVDKMLSYVEEFNLDGINADWEYPDSDDASNLFELLKDLKLGLLELEKKLYKKIELTAAVSASSFNGGAYNTSAFAALDYIYIMAFDNGSPHHSTTSFANGAIDFWINTKSCPSQKIIIGIPFYSSGNSAYSSFSGSKSTAAQYYNDADGLLNGRDYNSKPMINDKINYMKSKGGSGIFIWEITQDRTDEYSLLNVIVENLYPNGDLSSKKHYLNTGVNVYPTYFSNEINVSITDATVKTFNYNLVDLTGKLISQGTMQNNSQINISGNLPSGFYLLNINVGEEQKTIKLVHK